MKAFVFYTTVIMFCFASCTKDKPVAGKESISVVGKWNVITDSSFAGVGLSNQPLNYTGQQGDYFDFDSDGKLYIKENNILSTYNYTLISTTTLIIESFGITINGVQDTTVITYKTPGNITLYTPLIITPGGAFGRKVHLSR